MAEKLPDEVYSRIKTRRGPLVKISSHTEPFMGPQCKIQTFSQEEEGFLPEIPILAPEDAVSMIMGLCKFIAKSRTKSPLLEDLLDGLEDILETGSLLKRAFIEAREKGDL